MDFKESTRNFNTYKVRLWKGNITWEFGKAIKLAAKNLKMNQNLTNTWRQTFLGAPWIWINGNVKVVHKYFHSTYNACLVDDFLMFRFFNVFFLFIEVKCFMVLRRISNVIKIIS